MSLAKIHQETASRGRDRFPTPEWPETEKLKYEKEAADFYMSSHPLAQFETELRRYVSHEVERASETGPRRPKSTSAG